MRYHTGNYIYEEIRKIEKISVNRIRAYVPNCIDIFLEIAMYRKRNWKEKRNRLIFTFRCECSFN